MKLPLHILICSFQFGIEQGAEGICTMRLSIALVDNSFKVTVVTSNNAEETDGMEVIKVPAWSYRPYKLFTFIDKVLSNWRLLGKDYHIFWQMRAYMMQLPKDIDVIYGRCMPFSSAITAWRLARKWNKPLIIHFSDPVLSPWYTPGSIPLFFLKNYYKKIVSFARAVTFVTDEAIDYSERTMGVPLREKAFVLNHIAPKHTIFGPKTNKQEKVFLYAGNFYGQRNAKILLKGFSVFYKNNKQAVFRYFGTTPSIFEQEAIHLNLERAIQVFPFKRDIVSEFKEADILVAIDAADEDPVFLSTKFVEYLMVDRFVLLISPKNSPASKLARKFPETVLAIEEDTETIDRGIEELASRDYKVEDFKRRFSLMQDFLPDNVSSKFFQILEKLL